MPNFAYFGIGLLVGLALGLAFTLLRRKQDLAQPLGELERRLSDAFARVSTDMAERLEKTKGDLEPIWETAAERTPPTLETLSIGSWPLGARSNPVD